ncbi:MAG: ATP-dependent DNA ligase [Acidobacteria bacterium]|nr:MAG: ATP-dependent DNA ligase [Acidobacteriota bacterium]
MKRFAALYDAIDRTMSTNAKVAALAAYFRDAPPGDAAWATFFLTGRRLKRLIASASLRAWAQEIADIPEWLLGECYAAAGDFAEVVALLIDALPAHAREPDVPLAAWIHDRILPLAATDEAEQRARVTAWWRGLPRNERFLLNKLLTGEFRVGVAQTLVVRALAQAAQAEPTAIAARLMGDWTPTADWFSSLMAQAHTADPSRPYPFFLASPLEDPPETLGDRSEWLVEWKWDGIRAQLVRRAGEVWLWSRGEELITRRFPEIAAAATHVPDGTVLDGEVLAFGGGRPRPFSALQQRIGRQRQLAQIMRAVPVVFMAYDVMERDATDIRTRPLEERRAGLIAIVAHDGVLRVSEEVTAPSWDALSALRDESRARGVEGFMLKRRSSPYGVGRRRGDWWKWKIAPLTVDAVLIYAQPGNGRRASLLTDYTFGVWDGDTLVPVAKAYSGLSNAEIEELDRWIRRHTRERHGPVRAVDPVQVFELGFEAIAPSTRHRSGLAVRFPRMLHWRRDKPASEADTLETLKRMASLNRE